MFLPLGDEPNPRGIPFATYALIAVNCAVYILITLPLGGIRPDPGDPALLDYVQVIGDALGGSISAAELMRSVSAYDLLVFDYGFRPAEPRLVSLFTSMFLHGSFMHLAGNMLFLWIYGDNVEHRLGRVSFIFWYAATGVAATASHAVLSADSPLPVVGASGAISGLLGFYFVWFPHNRVRLWVVLFPFFANVVYAPARFVLGIYLVVDNLLPFVATRGLQGAGVAYGAHIGGFVAGLVTAWVMNRQEAVARPVEFATRQSVVGGPEAIGRLIDDRRLEEAAQRYFALPAERTRRILTPAQAIELGNWLADDHPRAALAVFQRHLRDYPIGPNAAEAHLGAGLVQLYALDQPTAAYQHLVEALDLDPTPQTAGLARQTLQAIVDRRRSAR